MRNPCTFILGIFLLFVAEAQAQMLDGRSHESCSLTLTVGYPLPLDTAFLRNLKLSSMLIVRKDSAKQSYFDSARYTFDASGKVRSFKEYWPYEPPQSSTCMYAKDGHLASIVQRTMYGTSKEEYEFDQQQHFVRYSTSFTGANGLTKADTTIRTWSGDTLKSERSREHLFRYSWSSKLDTLTIEQTYWLDPQFPDSSTRKEVFDANGRIVLQTGGTTNQYVYDGSGKLLERNITTPIGQSVYYRCFYHTDGSLEKITYRTSGDASRMPPGTGELRFYYVKRK